MRVTFSAAARNELRRIAEHIRQDAPERAASFVEELRASCLAIGDAPAAHPVVQENRRGAIRRRVHGRYLIYYQVHPEGLEILRVFHGARRPIGFAGR